MSSNTPRKRPNPRAEARKAAERRRRLTLIGGGFVVVVLAIGIAIASVGESASRITVEDVAEEVEVSGDPLPTLDGDAATDPAVGTPAPTVDGVGFDGETRQIGGGSGPQLVTFLASWCPACEQEMPELTDWLEQDRLPDEVELTAVATFLDEGRPNWPPQDWFDEYGYPGEVMVDDADATAAQAFGLSGTPFWVAIDGNGDVVRRRAGLLSMDELDAWADELAAGA